MYLTIVIVPVLALLSYFVWASACIGSGRYVRCICRFNDSERIFLSFDDGPHPERTSRILDILAQHHIKATFFLIGANAQKHQEIVRRIAREGHNIGNHSYTHSGFLPLKRSSRLIEEIDATSNLLETITGRPVEWYRPPFGVTNPMTRKALACTGLKAFGWSIRTFDTVSLIPRKWIARSVERQLKPGAIILLHDRCRDSDILLEMIIKKIKDKGWLI